MKKKKREGKREEKEPLCQVKVITGHYYYCTAFSSQNLEIDKQRQEWLEDKLNNPKWSEEDTLQEAGEQKRQKIISHKGKLVSLKHNSTLEYEKKLEELVVKYPVAVCFNPGSRDFNVAHYLSKEGYNLFGQFLAKSFAKFYNEGHTQIQLAGKDEIDEIANSKGGGEMFHVIVERVKEIHGHNPIDDVIRYRSAAESVPLDGSIILCPLLLLEFLERTVTMSSLVVDESSESVAVRPFTSDDAHHKMLQYMITVCQPISLQDHFENKAYTEKLSKISDGIREVRKDTNNMYSKMINNSQFFKEKLRAAAS
jgi:hypothetical protein